jgi:hypothetical protein
MPKSSKNCGIFITSSKGGDFFENFQQVSLTMLLETFSYSEMMNFHHKKKRKKNHWSIHFIILNIIYLNFFNISYLLITIKILEYLD